MQYIKAFFRIISANLLASMLFLLPFIFVLHALLASPAPLKRAIQGTDLYAQGTNSIINEALKGDLDPQTKQLLTTPEIRKVVTDAFPASFMQTTVENGLDSFYAWLTGKSESITVKIDTTEPQRKLTAGITEYVRTRTANLPVCTRAQLATLNQNDLLNLPCLPAGTDVNAVASQFSNEFIKQTQILDKVSEKQIETPKDADGLRKSIKTFLHYFWLVPAVAAVALMTYLALSNERQKALRHIGWICLSTGVVLGIITLALSALFSSLFATIKLDPKAGEAMQVAIVKASQTLVNDAVRSLRLWVIGYMIIGVAILAGLYYYHKKNMPTTPVQP